MFFGNFVLAFAWVYFFCPLLKSSAN